MRNCLLLLAVVGVMLVGAPANSQYLFVDVNGDGKNSLNTTNPFHAGAPDDVLGPGVTSVDVWFVTNQNADGSAATCSQPFQINSYEFIFRSSGSGSVAYGAWTDNMTGMLGGALCGDGTICTGGADVWVAKYKFTYDPPGTYKVGTLAITVTGSPKIDFVTSSTLSGSAQTAFGSSCPGINGDNTLRLGQDYPTAHGTESPIPVTNTTWGKIKTLYQ